MPLLSTLRSDCYLNALLSAVDQEKGPTKKSGQKENRVFLSLAIIHHVVESNFLFLLLLLLPALTAILIMYFHPRSCCMWIAFTCVQCGQNASLTAFRGGLAERITICPAFRLHLLLCDQVLSDAI